MSRTFQLHSLDARQARVIKFCTLIVLAVLAATSDLVARLGSAEKSIAEDLEGKAANPFAMPFGHVIVLVFVRTDCPISNRYAPLIERLSEKYRDNAKFWLVYPDRAETAAQIKAHLKDFHYSIAALRDTRHALVTRGQVTITPEVAVFNSEGKLVYHGRIDNWYEDFGRPRAAATTHELEDAVSAALKGKELSIDHANAVGCYISDLK